MGKQRIEGIQILNVLLGRSKAWQNHPIVKAWRGYENALKYYINCIIIEWMERGFSNNMDLFDIPKVMIVPWWKNWKRLHYSHRAMLLHKDPFLLSNKFEVPPEYTSYGYIWTINVTEKDWDKPLAEITADIPTNLVHARLCPAVLKSGKRRGDTCNLLLKKDNEYCGRHSK